MITRLYMIVILLKNIPVFISCPEQAPLRIVFPALDNPVSAGTTNDIPFTVKTGQFEFNTVRAERGGQHVIRKPQFQAC